jgi:hypothetical protein
MREASQALSVRFGGALAGDVEGEKDVGAVHSRILQEAAVSAVSAGVVVVHGFAAIAAPGQSGKIEPDETDDDDHEREQDVHRDPPIFRP